MEEQSHGMKSVIAALFANILIACSKFVGFFLSGSSAMLNESIHSVVDCTNQIMLLYGDKKAQAKPDELHQFGQARAKYFFSTIVATMLFFGGGALGIYEAITKLLHPEHEVTNHLLIIGILIFGLVMESFSLHVALKEINHLNVKKLPILKFLRESRHSEVIIIFAEDTCGLIGLLLALVGTFLAKVTGNPIFDAIAALLIGLLLLLAAIFLAKEFYSLIVGEAVVKEDLDKIKECFNRKEVKRVIDIKTVHLGPNEILIAAKMDLNTSYEAQSYKIINDIEDHIRKILNEYKAYIYIEIDEYDENYKRRDQ